MRFLSLDLLRFGPFSDLRLELGEPSPGLHVLYGPNEAGKSTTLRAIVGFLFGIPETTPDAHTHKMSDLRVGARLALPSGECLHLVRRKGRISTLADAEGHPVDEALVRSALGGLGRDAFEAMFGLDHAGLRRGGDELLRAEGKVGESLFGAGLGASVLSVLRQLEQRAAAIFVPQGKNQSLPRALRAHSDAKRLVLERSLRPAEWHESADALSRALTERDETDATCRALDTQRDRTRRLATALPLLSRRAEIAREIGSMGPAPLLPEGAAEERRRAQQTAREAAARHDSLARALGEIERQLDELGPPGPLLARGELVEDLQARLGAYRRARSELPRLEAEVSTLDEGARLLARSLGPSLEVLEREPAPGPATQARLRALGEERARLEARRRDAARSLETKRARLDLEAGRLGDLPPVREAEGLRRSVERTRRAGDLDGRLHAHESELARLEGDVQRQANALGLVSGPAEDLAALPLPPAESCERTEREWHKFQQERDRLDAQIEELGEKLADLDARRGALEAGSTVPSEADLGEARRARDAGWQALRRRLLGPSLAPPSSVRPPPSVALAEGLADAELADVFEADLRRSDEIGDRLRREADRVAELATLVAQRDQVAQRRAGFVQRRRALATKFDACQARWRSLWEPAGIASPLGPTEMRAWLGRHQRVVDLTRQLEQAQSTHATLLAQRRELQRDLTEALGLLGAEAPAERGGLLPLLDHAESVLARLEALARERLELSEAAQALSSEVLELEREGSVLEGELARWHEAWTAAVGNLGLGPEATTDEAALALDARNALATRLEELRSQRARLGELGAEVEVFERDAASLVAAAANDLAPLPLGEAAEALARRYRKACEDRARHRALAERRDGLLAQLEECRASRALAVLGLEALMKSAGCDDEAGLEAAEKRSARARELSATLSDLEARLRELGEGSPLEALEAEAAGADGPSLRAELSRLDAEIERSSARRAELDQLVGRLRERLRTMDGQAAAAEAAAEAQESLAQIQTLSDEYVTHALAALFLRQEIERHRERNQDPVLRRASELFRRLTLGAYRGLRADADERDEPVLRCLREGGAEVAVDALSDGTRDQLYLSLRLASIEGHVERQGPLPLAVDDILVHVDDERAAASLEALAELATRTQVLFFTHHRRLVDIAERVVPPELLATHWLDRTRRRPEPTRPAADLADEGDRPPGPDGHLEVRRAYPPPAGWTPAGACRMLSRNVKRTEPMAPHKAARTEPMAPHDPGRTEPMAPFEASPPPPPPPKRRRTFTYVLVTFIFLLLGAGIAGYLRLPAFAKRLAEERALERGVVLNVGAVDIAWGWVRLRDVTFSPVGIAGVKGRSDRVTVDLDRLDPTRISARSATLELEGPLARLSAEIDAWSKRYPASTRPPIAADGITLSWRQSPGEAPWLEATNAQVQADANAGSFYAPSSKLLGVSAGELSASWAAGRDDLAAGLGGRDPNHAPMRLEVRPGSPLRGRLQVVPTPLPKLGNLLSMRINEPDVSAEAAIDLTLTPGPERDTIEGKAELTLHGYIPPRPRELQGIVYGKSTQFGTTFRLSDDRRSVALTDTTLKAGALALRGGGSAERYEGGAKAKLDLAGRVPCTALARSAATANLGDLLGNLFGDVADATVQGSLGVNARVEIDTKDLDRARVTPTVTGNCALKF